MSPSIAFKYFVSGKSGFLYRKGGSATTGAACIGVLKNKAAIIQSILPVDLHAIQVHFMRFIHDAGNALNIKSRVVVLLMIKTKNICHPGTASPLHSYTQCLCGIKALFTHQSFHLGHGAGCQ